MLAAPAAACPGGGCRASVLSRSFSRASSAAMNPLITTCMPASQLSLQPVHTNETPSPQDECLRGAEHEGLCRCTMQKSAEGMCSTFAFLGFHLQSRL